MKHFPKMKNNSPDNFQTEDFALECLVKYIPKTMTIWEPACGNGNLVRGFKNRGYRVFASDVVQGQDFLNSLPWIPDWDCIVTNPPFSIKEKFLGRCYNLGKPFALLMPISTFDSVERRSLMNEFGVEVILPSRRINFETPNHEKNKAIGKKTSSWFYSAWFTNGFNIGNQLNFS